MKHIYIPLLSMVGLLYASSAYAQQLVAPSGGESPAASWVLGEIVGGHCRTDDGIIVQGFLSYIDLGTSVGMENEEWQSQTVIWPSPVGDYLNIAVPPSASVASIAIYSLHGVLMKQFNVLGASFPYDVSSLVSGVYSVRLADISGKTVVTKKIIKL